jgi:pimeloyl-ACP methyl ester carboxylesterase
VARGLTRRFQQVDHHGVLLDDKAVVESIGGSRRPMRIRPSLSIALAGLVALAGCDAVSARLFEWKKGRYRSAARLVEKRVSVAGHDWVYLDRGTGEPLVLVHGFGADKDNWTFLAAKIPDAYRVIAVDLPGFGESTRRLEERYDARTQAARLLAFLDALHVDRAHFVGNSMGGAIATRLALDHPERVRSLTLLDPGGIEAPHPSEVALARARGENLLLVDSVEDFDRLMGLLFVKPPDIPGFIKSYFARRAVENRAFNDKVFADLMGTPDRLESELHKVTAPTLIIWGDKDRIIDVSAAAIWNAGIPGSKLVLLPDCGHVPMIERPEESAREILALAAAHDR